MTHEQIFEYFMELLGLTALDVKSYAANTENSIRITLENPTDEFVLFYQNELIFTLEPGDKWRLETVDFNDEASPAVGPDIGEINDSGLVSE